MLGRRTTVVVAIAELNREVDERRRVRQRRAGRDPSASRRLALVPRPRPRGGLSRPLGVAVDGLVELERDGPHGPRTVDLGREQEGPDEVDDDGEVDVARVRVELDETQTVLDEEPDGRGELEQAATQGAHEGQLGSSESRERRNRRAKRTRTGLRRNEGQSACCARRSRDGLQNPCASALVHRGRGQTGRTHEETDEDGLLGRRLEEPDGAVKNKIRQNSVEKGEGKFVSGSPDCDDGRVVCERGQGQSSEKTRSRLLKANAQVCSIVTKSEVTASSVC